MSKSVAILHYASPPGIGGVESTIAHQSRQLAALGYPVRVVSGKGGSFDPQVETCIHPLLGSTHPDILAVKAELDAGVVSETFQTLTIRIYDILREYLADCDVCIAHNVTTLHKNLLLTTALHQLQTDGYVRLVAWCHDLAWGNPQYQADLHDGLPWDLLRQPWPSTSYVTVSEARCLELANLLGIPPQAIDVVTPGVDPGAFFRWTPTMSRIVDHFALLRADGLLLLPARITRRKNIALALRVLSSIRALSGRDFRLVVTGPPGPHNPKNLGYLGDLLDLRRDFDLNDAAHFLYTLGESPETPLHPDDDTMANLYQLADGLFFPSTEEGFGIPVLEAGLVGLPIFCADIPPLRGTAGDDATYFDPVAADAQVIAAQILATLESYAPCRLKARVRRQYRWETIIQGQLVPLLEGV